MLTSGGWVDPKYQYIYTNFGINNDQYFFDELIKYQYTADFLKIMFL